MMDTGYKTQPSKAFPEHVLNDKRLFLFKIPKDVDLKTLDSVRINLKGVDNKIGHVTTDSGPFDFEIRRENSKVEDIMRPILYKDEDDNKVSRVGPAFEETFSLVKLIRPDVKPARQNETATSYQKLAQIQGLAIRCLPFGSFTALSDLHARIRSEKVVNTSMKSSKAVESTRDNKRKRVKGQADADDSNSKPVALPLKNKDPVAVLDLTISSPKKKSKKK